MPRTVLLAPGSIGCIFGELLIKDAIMKGTGELDVSVVHRPPGRMVRRSGNHIASTSSRDMLSTPPPPSPHNPALAQQIQKIFHLLGTPNEENWPEFSSLPNAGTFKWKGRDGSELGRRFSVNSPLSASSGGRQSYLDGAGFDLLGRLLALNPRDRIGAEEALGHKYFKEGVKMQVPDFFT